MKQIGILLLSLPLWIFAQDPSIRIVEQDCTSGGEFVLIQARVYNSGGKPVKCQYRYSDLAGRTFNPLNLTGDDEDESLFWGFIPEKPSNLGVTSGVLEYTVEVESAFGESFSESAVIQVTPSCFFNPSFNPRQADVKATLEDQLTAKESFELERRVKARKKRRRNLLIGGGVLLGAGVAAASGSSSDPDPEFVLTANLVPDADREDMIVAFTSNAPTTNVVFPKDNASLVQTVTATGCIDVLGEPPANATELLVDVEPQISDAGFRASLTSVAISVDDIPLGFLAVIRQIDSDGSGEFEVRIGDNQMIEVVQDYFRNGENPDGEYETLRFCDSNSGNFTIDLSFTITPTTGN